MAWENKIVGYHIKGFQISDLIPVGAIFLVKEKGHTRICGSDYPYIYYYYQVPVYKKVRTKKQ